MWLSLIKLGGEHRSEIRLHIQIHLSSGEKDQGLPNDKILDKSKFKALADDKINLTNKLKLVLGMVENILGKGENAGYQHFLLFPKCFQKPPSLGSLKVGIVW